MKDNLGDRMKKYYEEVPKTRLMKKCPVAIRIDGRAFHTFTKNFNKPFDTFLITAMQKTMKYLCENIAGCVFGYTQSDEITLILIDYQKLETSVWFDYEVQKMCSISASMATLAFNKFLKETVDLYEEYYQARTDTTPDRHKRYIEEMYKAIDKGAMFDARCFNIPKEEVANLIYWRQLDAIKNSVQMVAHIVFSHKDIQGKNTEEVKQMLLERNCDWNLLPINKQRGSACYKVEIEEGDEYMKAVRHRWIIDNEMPIIKGEDREYIEKYILI